MKKSILLFICIVGLNGISVQSQELKLEDVISKYHQTIGLDKMKDWKTMVMTGKSIAQGMELPVTIMMKRPGKIRLEVEIQGTKMIQGFDGEHGWSVVPWSGSTEPQDMTPDEAKVLMDQGDFEGALFNWKEKGHKAELLGKDDMDGTPVYKIKVDKVNGNTETYFIDAENFILLKSASVTKIQGNETESESFMSNYKDVNGIMMPFTVENKFKGQTISNVTVEKYEVNKELDDALFSKPVKK
jgi:outer membrane lipoprotein-sorting protein